jgi:hypothetical protein
MCHSFIQSDKNWTELFAFRHAMLGVSVSLRKSFLQFTRVVKMTNCLKTSIGMMMIQLKRIWWIFRKCLQIEWRMIEAWMFHWMKILWNPIGFVNIDSHVTNSNHQCWSCFHWEWKSVLSHPVRFNLFCVMRRDSFHLKMNNYAQMMIFLVNLCEQYRAFDHLIQDCYFGDLNCWYFVNFISNSAKQSEWSVYGMDKRFISLAALKSREARFDNR